MSPPDRVTVVGAGTMGVGIAVVFAASGRRRRSSTARPRRRPPRTRVPSS